MLARLDRRRLVGLVCATVLGVFALGCNTLQGARLYVEGTHALEAGDARAAVSALERAALVAPDASEVHNHLGLAYLASERPDAAWRAFERAVALDCGNEAAQHNLRLLRAHPSEP